MKARIAIASTLAVLTALVLTATASASEPLEDGDYSITLPDSSEIHFTISDDGETVEVVSVPKDFSVDEDDSSDDGSTEITNGEVTVEIKTGDDGKIEVEGISFDEESTVSAMLPDAGTVEISLEGDEVDVKAPGFEVIDVDSDDEEAEVRITDGKRTFEIEVDYEDGSIEIKLQDDSSDDDSSDDETNDSTSDDDDSSDDATDTSDDSTSDDDDSSDEVTSVDSVGSGDDDENSDDNGSDDEQQSGETALKVDSQDDDDESEDDDSDDDSDDESSD